ncbi:hypothetical protein DPMN_164054 [Dreissena polymorpha]|uniref:Uncharacterized protein n=1 Tax=Dreissena polymorpha TaxID=45954 RepID=A0A9D4IVR6_DREPO|nr:hypothetical protein DPMN_164054 [Dreissena polymorpha]
MWCPPNDLEVTGLIPSVGAFLRNLQETPKFNGTTEDGSFGRLVNDSTYPKVQCFEEEGLPSLYFVALCDILPLVRRYR